MIAPQQQSKVGLTISIVSLFVFVLIALLVQIVLIGPVLQRDDASLAAGLSLQQRLLYSSTTDSEISEDVVRYVRALRDGGQIIALDGRPVRLPADNSEQIVASADVTELLAQGGESNQFADAFASTLQYVRSRVNTHRQRARWFQSAVLVNALLLVAFIFSQFTTRLRRANLLWNATMLENKTILEATNDGLFLIKPSLQVGSVQSNAVQRIFGLNQPIRGNFFDFLKRLVSSDDLEQAKEYILLMLQGQGKASLLHNLNPLQEVEVTVENAVGLVSTRYVSFDFARNELNPQAGLLVSVRDITNEVELKQELVAASRGNDERFSLLMASMNSDTPALAAFCRDATATLQQIEAKLNTQSRTDQRLDDTLKAVRDDLHELKKQAIDVGVSLIETSAVHLESQIEQLLGLPEVDGEHMTELTSQVNNMMSELVFLEQLNTRFDAQQLASKPVLAAVGFSSNATLSTPDGLQRFAQELAERHGKHVSLEKIGFEQFALSNAIQDELSAICTQLVSNAVVHGIEVPELRHQREKAGEGRIIVALRDLDDDAVLLTVKDDGGGFDFDAIRKAAVERKLITSEAAHEMEKDELVRFIFVAGFSTRAGADGNTGQGQGLDFVRNAIVRLGGKISVKSSRGVSAKISIRLPRSVLCLDEVIDSEVVLKERASAL